MSGSRLAGRSGALSLGRQRVSDSVARASACRTYRHWATVATRNTKGFELYRVALVNPWGE